jgi:hypothetical protein
MKKMVNFLGIFLFVLSVNVIHGFDNNTRYYIIMSCQAGSTFRTMSVDPHQKEVSFDPSICPVGSIGYTFVQTKPFIKTNPNGQKQYASKLNDGELYVIRTLSGIPISATEENAQGTSIKMILKGDGKESEHSIPMLKW